MVDALLIATTVIGIIIISIGVAIDVISFVLGVRRVLFRKGPSGLPLVPIGFYVLGSFLVGTRLGKNAGWFIGINCVVFHVLIQYVLLIPFILIRSQFLKDKTECKTRA